MAAIVLQPMTNTQTLSSRYNRLTMERFHALAAGREFAGLQDLWVGCGHNSAHGARTLAETYPVQPAYAPSPSMAGPVMVSFASNYELKRRKDDDVAFTGVQAAVPRVSVSQFPPRTVLCHIAVAAVLARNQVVRPITCFSPIIQASSR